MPGMPYVALGDSFAAGIGSRSGGGRHRQDGGYPPELARRLGLAVGYEAYLGATVPDIRATQLADLGPDTQLVTITAGGNDAGYTPVVLAAAKPRWLADARPLIAEFAAHVRRHLPHDLGGLIRDVRRLAPHARIVLTGYPQLFTERDCRWYTFFSAEELAALRAGTDDLVDLVLSIADKHDVLGVDVRAAFDGHQACDADPWIHHVTWPFRHSFHPTSAGHRAYVDAIVAALDADTRPAPAARPLVSPGPDRCGSGGCFDLPTLLTAGQGRPPHLRDHPAARRVGEDDTTRRPR